METQPPRGRGAARRSADSARRRRFARTIDVRGRRIVVEPPEGLLELNERRDSGRVKIDIVTIFPAMVQAGLAEGVVGRAIGRRLLDVGVHDLRDFTTDRHRVVDDMPFGGGPGMVMKPEPLFAGGGGDSRPSAASRTRWCCCRRRAGGSRRRRRAVEPDCGTWCCCAAATRASTSGCARRWRPRSCRSATTCCRAANCRRWSIVDAVARLVPGVVGDEAVGGGGLVHARAAGLPALHAAGGVRGHGGARRCCCRGTTPRFGAGGGARRCGGRWSGGRICWTTAELDDEDASCCERDCCSERVTKGAVVMTADRDRREGAADRAAGDQVGRHRPRARQGARRRQGAHPDLRGDRHRHAPRRHARVLHRAQGVVRPGRGAHLPAALADRSTRSRSCASAKVRRAKLYFLRDLKGKAARMKEAEAATRLDADSAGPRPHGQSPRAMRTLENALRRYGFDRVAGVDEVGRGCLAGPVVAGAVVLDPDRYMPGVGRLQDGHRARARAALRRRSSRKRGRLGRRLRRPRRDRPHQHPSGVAAGDAAGRPGARSAARTACWWMRFASRICRWPSAAVIHGDRRCTAIAAASIVAKVTRDRHDATRCTPRPAIRIRSAQGLCDRRALDGRGAVWLFAVASAIVQAADAV